MAGMIAASQKGSLLLMEVRKRYPNYHPVIAMVDIAHHADASLDLQFNCHKTIAKYIEPELKSIEVKGDFKQQQTVRVSLFGDNEPETVAYQDVPSMCEAAVNEAVSTGYTLVEDTGF